MPMRVRDISGWIYTGMWSYCPEHPGAEVTDLPQPGFLRREYEVFSQRFVLGGQSGTYIETKAHVARGAAPVVDLPLDEFARPAVVIDVGRKSSRDPVTVADLEATAPDLRPGDAALIATGWDSHWEEPDFVSGSPYIHRDAAFWLMDRGIGLLGGDIPRFDSVPDLQFPWVEFFDRVNLLLAPLTSLTGLSGRCGLLLAFPLKIRGAVATPCRAAILLDEGAAAAQ